MHLGRCTLQGPYGRAYGNTFQETLQSYAPVVQGVWEQVSDPIRRVGVLKVKIAEAKRNGQWDKVRKLEAELLAAEEAAAVKRSSTESGQAWRQGVTRNLWVVTGIGVSAIVLLGAAAYRTSRRRSQ
jgi:hypothetical protein